VTNLVIEAAVVRGGGRLSAREAEAAATAIGRATSEEVPCFLFSGYEV
jgi:hypothetical protein